MKRKHLLLALLFIFAVPTILVAQDLYVGSNVSDTITTFTSGSSSYSNVYIGYDASALSNTLGVFNTNTTLINSNAFQVGVGGSFNSLVVSNGGVVSNIGSITIGVNSSASNNSALVTGPGSTLTNQSYAYLGYYGSSNSLIVSNGGLAGLGNGSVFYIASDQNSSNNSVLITGSNSRFISAKVYLGGNGYSNNLTISNGGSMISTDDVNLGNNATASNNSVLITGTNSSWDVSTNMFIVGNNGSSNSLVISSGGRLSSVASIIGNNSNSLNNLVVVTGTNSLWSNTSQLAVGLFGSSNRLTISNGGSVICDDYVTIGDDANASNNSVLITGTNSSWDIGANVVAVGKDGFSNSLVISNGGRLRDRISVIGYSNNSLNNLATVTGTNSVWTNSDEVYVGFLGSSNQLTISRGAAVFVDSNSYVGAYASSSNNSAVVTGTNSSWSNGSQFFVGALGASNQLTISNGAQVASRGEFFLGYATNASNNRLLITGTNAVLNCSSNISIGNNGSSNALTISNGGKLISQHGYLGRSYGASSNLVQVIGEGSIWTNARNLYVGDSGPNSTLIISNGGMVVNQYGYLGNGYDGTNSCVVVTGTGSTWSNAQDLYIGAEASYCSLIVSNGGTVVDINGILDTPASSNNTVVVTDSNSLWSNSGSLTIGQDGVSNTVTVVNGGTVVASNIVIASGSNSTGVLNFGSYGDSNTAGSVKTPSIAFGDGTGNINFNQTNTLVLTSSISGEGVVQQLGSGRTIFKGSNSYTGITDVYQGTVDSGSTNAFGNSTLTLNGGNAKFSSPTTIYRLTWFNSNSLMISETPGVTVVNITGDIMTSNSTNYWSLGRVDNNTNLILITVGTNDNLTNLAIAGITNGVIIKETIGGTNFYYSYVAPGSDIVVTGTEIIASNTTVGSVSFSNNSTLVIATNGTLNATNNYTSTNSGTLEYYFTTSSESPRMIVSNTATLGGSLVVHYANGTQDGDVNQLMSAGSISGSFSSITGDHPERYRYRGVCVGDPEYYVVTAPASYTIVAANQNQVNVASALNSFVNAAGDYGTVSADLDYLTDPQYPNVFNQISPALYTTLATVAFNSAVAQYNEMVQRLGNIRVAGIGFSSMGMDNSPIMDDSKNPKSNDKDILIPSPDNHWGFFVDGNGIFANINIKNQLPGYSAEGGGVTIGSDYKWNNEFSTGLYAGYEGLQSKQSGGNYVSDNGSRFGAFGTYQRGGFFMNGILGGDSHSYFVKRSIQFQGPNSIAPALNRTASSAPTAGELDSMLATGYDIKRGNFTFGPITSLQYTYFGLQPFTETGAQSLDLSVQNANANSMVYSLGSHCFYNWQASKNILVVPQINMAWQHEFLQNPYALDSSFGNGATFNYMSTTPLRDTLYTGIGVTVNFNKKYDASFFYNASACNPDLVSQNFFVSLGTSF